MSELARFEYANGNGSFDHLIGHFSAVPYKGQMVIKKIERSDPRFKSQTHVILGDLPFAQRVQIGRARIGIVLEGMNAGNQYLSCRLHFPGMKKFAFTIFHRDGYAAGLKLRWNVRRSAYIKLSSEDEEEQLS